MSVVSHVVCLIVLKGHVVSSLNSDEMMMNNRLVTVFIIILIMNKIKSDLQIDLGSSSSLPHERLLIRDFIRTYSRLA